MMTWWPTVTDGNKITVTDKSDDSATGLIAQNVSDVLPEAILEDLLTISSTTGSGSGSLLGSGLNSTYQWNTANNYHQVVVNNQPSYVYQTNGYSNITTGTPGIRVTGDAEFDGDVKIKGVNITETIEKINARLGILVPDPDKLEHFEALKKAYAHYKTLEALCELPIEEKDDK